MSEELRRRKFAAAVAVLCSLCWCGVGRAADQQKVTLSGPDLLKPVPAVGEVTVAKVAPEVEVTLLSDLPAGPKGTLWSSWGDGCVASNGKYYLAVGNHLDWPKGLGQSRVYEYDPASKALKLVVNLRDVIPDEKTAAGKVHAKIDEGADGWLYFATYWGKTPGDAEWEAGFKGSALLRYDPRTGKAEDLGIPVLGQGLPTSVADGERMLMYAYAVKSGDLVAYDLSKRKVKFRGGGDLQKGDRAILLDAAGNAYFGTTDGGLACYDLESNSVDRTEARLPGTAPVADPKKAKKKAKAGDDEEKWVPTLRAAAEPSKDGLLYGMTYAGVLFSFDPKAGTTKDLGPNVGSQYTAVMAFSPDQRFIYYAPGAHGSGSRIGTPVVQYDVKANRHKVLAFLNPALREKLNYNVGGTYNLKVSPDGSALFVTFNGAMVDPSARKEETFGLPCVAVVHIPEEER